MTKRRLETDGAPRAMGPYSQGIVANGFCFCAGQLGLDPATGELVEGGVGPQTERALTNLLSVLDATGLSLADVVKTTCFLADIADFAAFNEAYARLMPDPFPARSTFAVGELPKKGALIEIEAIATFAQV